MRWLELKQVVDSLSFRDWEFQLSYGAGFYENPLSSPMLRVCFTAPDNETWEDRQHTGRWWKLSYHMVKGEIVQTALKAVLTALEHEAREQFLYQGVAIYGPHIDPDVLLEAAQTTEVR